MLSDFISRRGTLLKSKPSDLFYYTKTSSDFSLLVLPFLGKINALNFDIWATQQFKLSLDNASFHPANDDIPFLICFHLLFCNFAVEQKAYTKIHLLQITAQICGIEEIPFSSSDNALSELQLFLLYYRRLAPYALYNISQLGSFAHNRPH